MIKRKVKYEITPYFEIGTKNYVYGDKLLEYAIAADKAAEKYDIDVLYICPAVEIRRVVENTKNLIAFWYSDGRAPSMPCSYNTEFAPSESQIKNFLKALNG